MNDRIKFGQFISEKRIRRSMNKQELAQLIGISTAYLSQLESGVRSNPTMEILADFICILELNEAEIYMMYDLYASANDTIPPDIQKYIKYNRTIMKALRLAEKNKTDENDWLEFIDRINK